MICAAARGEESPHEVDVFEMSATTPEAILKALQDSIAYCDTAYSALTDATAGEMLSGFGGTDSRAGIFTGKNEHYDNLVTYLRFNGLAPPSSVPSQ